MYWKSLEMLISAILVLQFVISGGFNLLHWMRDLGLFISLVYIVLGGGGGGGLHESGLSYNPDRSHSICVETIGD